MNMKIGLIDVDGHNFPNLCLMKISAYHKAQGDSVDWWSGFEYYDHVYVSRVFDDTYTSWQEPVINADHIHFGGTGYDIENKLPPEIENQCPDYSLYPQFTESHGSLTRGCPNNCSFCIVSRKEGRKSVQVADLDEFHRGQREVKLLDPNLLACKDHERLLQQLIDSKVRVDFTQGLDARLLNPDNIELLQKVKKKLVHFAWDTDNHSGLILSNLQKYKECTGVHRSKAIVYVLTNYDTDFQFDLYRVDTLRQIGLDPYVMIYDKGEFVECDKNGKPIRLKEMSILLKKYTIEQIRHFKKCWHLQRWVNNRIIWSQCERFEDYDPKVG